MRSAERNTRFGLAAIIALMVVLIPHSSFLTPHCSAHPVPKAEFDRNITVNWRTDGVHILYRLEIDEYTLLTTVTREDSGFQLDLKKGMGRKAVIESFINRMKEIIPDSVLCTVDGKQLLLKCVDGRTGNSVDSVQFLFKLKVDAPLVPGRHSLEIEDINFIDKKGRLILKLEAEDGLKIEKLSEPPENTSAKLTEAQRRTLTATVLVQEAAKTAVPATSEVEPIPEPEPTGFWELLGKVQKDESLAVLLDSNVGLWMILLIAALHGVLHSVSPGHGKTMVAAYLVGEQGTPRHAIILGLIVTLTHTSTAFGVALLLKFVLPPTAAPTVQQVLGIGGGVLVAFIGLWLLMQRVAGRSDHFHVGSHSHGHGHSHGDDSHSHSHGLTPEHFARVGWIRLILLGISGGIVPCWGAILWVIYCVSAGRYGLAFYAVLAFSIGLASILILIGLGVVWSGRAGSQRFGGTQWFRIVSKWLPIVGAAMVLAIGLWLVNSNLK